MTMMIFIFTIVIKIIITMIYYCYICIIIYSYFIVYWKLEDLEQQRRPLLGDEDCRRWKPGCSCSSSDQGEEEEKDDEDDEDGVGFQLEGL